MKILFERAREVKIYKSKPHYKISKSIEKRFLNSEKRRSGNKSVNSFRRKNWLPRMFMNNSSKHEIFSQNKRSHSKLPSNTFSARPRTRQISNHWSELSEVPISNPHEKSLNEEYMRSEYLNDSTLIYEDAVPVVAPKFYNLRPVSMLNKRGKETRRKTGKNYQYS